MAQEISMSMLAKRVIKVLEKIIWLNGKPTQNGYIERFNGSYRRAVLDRYIFRNISEVRELTEAWRKDYNEERPHEALDNMTPFEYREELIKRKEAV